MPRLDEGRIETDGNADHNTTAAIPCSVFRRRRRGLWLVHVDADGGWVRIIGEVLAQSEIAEVLKIKHEVNSIAQWRAIGVTQGFGHPQFQALREKASYAGLRRAGFPDE